MLEARVERRLVAILAADVSDYSRLMSADEAGTLAALQAHRSELITPTIERHCGRIVKVMGDGILAEFGSVVEAVECATEIQREMEVRNRGAPAISSGLVGGAAVSVAHRGSRGTSI
jgi:adenylate cyclase